MNQVHDIGDDELMAFLTADIASDIAPRIKIYKGESAPLSFAQQRLWFLQQYDLEDSSYNLPRVIHIQGELDVSTLELALNKVIERHDILRTRYVYAEGEDGIPRQIVEENIKLNFTLLNISELSSDEQQQRFTELARIEATTPFDLFKAGQLRVKLICFSIDKYALLITMHHIASDGQSNPILIKDLSQAFTVAMGSNPNDSLPKLAIQYADFAAWQRDSFSDNKNNTGLEYWKSYLGAKLSPLELPIDFPRTSEGSRTAGYCNFKIDQALTSKVYQLSSSHDTTPFNALMAAWQILLSRYSGQVEFGIGVPNANRHIEETQDLVGCFMSTQVYKVQLQPDDTVSDFLQRLRGESIAALKYADVPFELLLDTIKVERSSNRTPLFQTIFDWRLEDDSNPELTINNLQLTIDIGALEQAKFDLSLGVTATAAGELICGIEYDASIFEQCTIDRLAKYWQHLLQGIVEKPCQRIAELPLLDQTEQQQIIEDWNDTAVDYDSSACIHQLFEQQAQRNPNNTALVFEEEKLSYRELNQKANQLAHKLRELGVTSDTLVGIAVERSLEMVIGLLAILKADGAYVPLDPDYPSSRLAYMIEDSGIELLLTQSHIEKQLTIATTVETKLEVLLLDEVLRDNSLSTGTWAEYSAENLVNHNNSANLAYVIYTSGSTGKPKGVLQTHHNVNRLLQATEQWFNFTDNDVWTLFHSYAFDFSIWEIFGALLHGGKLVVVPFEVTRSPSDLYNLLCKEKVTVLNQTPSAFGQLMPIACANNKKLTSTDDNAMALRYVVFGGETLDVASLRPWFECFGDKTPQLINMYGITETTVHVTYRPLLLVDMNKAGSPIGQVINDLTWYVLDSDLSLVAKGCSGELYVGRSGLARGYHQRQGLTAERFIADPFSDEGGRLYRTGDLARYQADGTIEYVGRIDHQVKIRGFRIELGEIESQLQSHDTIRDAVVLAQEGNAGQQLVAYLIPNDSQLAGADSDSDSEVQHILRADIKKHLQKLLPEYMVPAHILFLEKLPLTPNGKLDRKALPKADASQLQQLYEAPTTDLEVALIELWQEILSLEKIGITDSFFELGGHSLLMVRLVTQVKRQFDVDLALKDFYLTSFTIENMALLIENKKENNEGGLDLIFEALDELAAIEED
jgi:amino acid adenylation domain-containing protein